MPAPRSICLLALLPLAAGLNPLKANAAPNSGGPAEPSGLHGDLLLDGLDDLIGVAPKAPDNPAAASPKAGRGEDAPGWLPNRKELDKLMKDSLDGKPPGPRAGEDLGESPLVTLRSTMDRAGRLIAAGGQPGETRPTQENVITQLDELIKKMEKQCQNCQAGGANPNPNQQQSRRSKPGQPKPQQQAGKKPGEPKGQSAARQSSLRLGKAEAADPDRAKRNAEVIKRVWGRLPERLREQMLQSTTDEFLPEYQTEIEQYFQRLAEDEEGK